MVRRRSFVLAGVVAVGAAGAVTFANVVADDVRDPREGSTVVDGPPVAIDDDVPRSYRITYRLDVGPDDRRTEVLAVRRPYDSRIEQYDADEPGGAPSVLEITTFGRSSRRVSGAASAATIAVPPGVASGDTRFDAVLDDALDAGLLERRERREVLERPCQVLRTGASPRLGLLEPPTAETYVDVCVDSDGLVLEEASYSGEQLRERRIAVAVEVGPRLDDDLFDVGARTVPVDRGGGVVRELEDGSRTPEPFLELPDELPLPHRGRYAVVPPQPDAFTEPELRGRRIGSTTDVLDRAADVVTVERGGTLEGVDVTTDPEGATSVALGPLGEGRLALTAQGPLVQVEFEGGRFLRIGGTLPADELTALARSLREVPGGQLTPVGEAW